MKVTISPKDTTSKITMDVDFYWQEGNCLCVRFKDGRIRMYPMCHIWYLEIGGVNEKT